MPGFKAGDRFQVPDEMPGAKLKWLGKQGTVVKVLPGSATGPVRRGEPHRMEFRPFYEVLFDGETAPEFVDEDMMRRAPPE